MDELTEIKIEYAKKYFEINGLRPDDIGDEVWGGFVDAILAIEDERQNTIKDAFLNHTSILLTKREVILVIGYLTCTLARMRAAGNERETEVVAAKIDWLMMRYQLMLDDDVLPTDFTQGPIQ